MMSIQGTHARVGLVIACYRDSVTFEVFAQNRCKFHVIFYH